ncbi:Mov34/MPN/PAD-1 family protein [Desulfobacterota bacterium M19]
MILNQKVLDAIIAHARRGLPHEVCGYLAGGEEEITRHYELTNLDKAADHFTMIPEEQFAVIKETRREGLTIKAVYHSHPDTPARPSAEDIKLAYDPDISYVIISLAAPEAVVKSFLIQQGEVSSEDITLI